MMDIASQYPCETAKKIPIGNYRFIQRFDENRYGQDKDYGCILLCDVKTTDKIKNNLLQKQIPMLFSEVKITDKNLWEYQINQIREKRNENENEKTEYRTQAEKLIGHLGNDENNYMSFEMYQMMKDAGYDIKIKAILEYKHKAVFKGYIESLYEKKRQYGWEEWGTFQLPTFQPSTIQSPTFQPPVLHSKFYCIGGGWNVQFWYQK